MNTIYRIYHSIVDKGKTADGAALSWAYGCNGQKHVDILDKIFYSGDGEVCHAEEVVRVVRGGCDRTCGTKRIGGFVHP